MELTVTVNSDTYQRLESRAKSHGFESVEEYSAVVLEEVMAEIESHNDDDTLESRLEDLGYL